MRAYAEVNLGAIAHNVKKIKAACNTEVLAVVKAARFTEIRSSRVRVKSFIL